MGTWVLSSLLLPAKLPADFPSLPETRVMAPAVRNLPVSADKDARRHTASAETIGQLAMAYRANEYFEQAAGAYRVAARLAHTPQWIYAHASLLGEQGNERSRSTCTLFR